MAMTVQNLVTSQQARSNLRWLAGQSGGDRPLHGAGVHAVDQIGYLNLMHAERIAVLGLRELDYYRKLDRHRRDRLHQTLLAGGGAPPPPPPPSPPAGVPRRSGFSFCYFFFWR